MKAKIRNLKRGDQVIHYKTDEESKSVIVVQSTVKRVLKGKANYHDVAIVRNEDGSWHEMRDTDYFDLVNKSNDLQQRKRSNLNNVPSHYQGTDGIDVIEFCRQQFAHDELIGALKFNIIKYATRIGRKNQDVEDVEKIGVYQRRLSEVLADE